MTLFEIFILAVALSADAFAVSVAAGICSKEVKTSDKLKMSFFFGSFQGLMPVIGWFAGFLFIDYIRSFDHWVAMGLLSIIGIKMIHESTKPEDCKSINYFKISVLTLLAIATSIDALAAGLSILLLDVDILYPAIFITCITFIISLIGINIGKKAGRKLGSKAELAGGIILILIGIKILIGDLLG